MFSFHRLLILAVDMQLQIDMFAVTISTSIDGFHGAWLHFWRARVGSVFSASVCVIQASKRYIESLPLVLKDKRSCFSQGERFAVQLPLERALALRK